MICIIYSFSRSVPRPYSTASLCYHLHPWAFLQQKTDQLPTAALPNDREEPTTMSSDDEDNMQLEQLMKEQTRKEQAKQRTKLLQLEADAMDKMKKKMAASRKAGQKQVLQLCDARHEEIQVALFLAIFLSPPPNVSAASLWLYFSFLYAACLHFVSLFPQRTKLLQLEADQAICF